LLADSCRFASQVASGFRDLTTLDPTNSNAKGNGAMQNQTDDNVVDTFQFIERMSAELAEMSAQNGEDLLSYLLSVSREEAVNVIARRLHAPDSIADTA